MLNSRGVLCANVWRHNFQITAGGKSQRTGQRRSRAETTGRTSVSQGDEGDGDNFGLAQSVLFNFPEVVFGVREPPTNKAA